MFKFSDYYLKTNKNRCHTLLLTTIGMSQFEIKKRNCEKLLEVKIDLEVNFMEELDGIKSGRKSVLHVTWSLLKNSLLHHNVIMHNDGSAIKKQNRFMKNAIVTVGRLLKICWLVIEVLQCMSKMCRPLSSLYLSQPKSN